MPLSIQSARRGAIPNEIDCIILRILTMPPPLTTTTKQA